MRQMKTLTLLAACACALASESTMADMPLAVRGQPAAYTIVVPEKASPSQRYAAEELRDYTEKATGVKLPIATDAAPLPPKAILLGHTKYTEGLVGRVALNAPNGGLGTDGFRLVARPPHLLVIGSPDRGALYGVYEVLERFVGCRWYASWCEKVPRLDRIAVPDTLDDSQLQCFGIRRELRGLALPNPARRASERMGSGSWRGRRICW